MKSSKTPFKGCFHGLEHNEKWADDQTLFGKSKKPGNRNDHYFSLKFCVYIATLMHQLISLSMNQSHGSLHCFV